MPVAIHQIYLPKSAEFAFQLEALSSDWSDEFIHGIVIANFALLSYCSGGIQLYWLYCLTSDRL